MPSTFGVAGNGGRGWRGDGEEREEEDSGGNGDRRVSQRSESLVPDHRRWGEALEDEGRGSRRIFGSDG